ncbi:PAS domain S-box protein [Belliella aquatica]|uniref:histidine kinase n=1 Tax=Belliella aquatica TaxID=1323734 RepID=A0ABQ1N6Q8_9BACT|nr:PAS domain S-box protein [Belliella aquatica]MCH7407654.1 PAS domain S-box protein [Belliella aquatica]GGC55180.1 hypothetical protein GCM10010993_36870 [Belliella aquatica]
MINSNFDYSTLFFHSPLPKWFYEIDTYQILEVNQAALNHYGFTKEEFLSLKITDLHTESCLPKLITAHKNIDSDQTNVYFGVFTHLKKNGEKIQVEINGHKIPFNGRDCITVICQDITEKEKQIHRLKLLESVVTNTHDAILITEAEPFDVPGPKIIYVNEAFSKMTGYQPEEVIGKTPRILQGPKSDQGELKRLSNAIRNWESCEITTINYKKNGEEFWINFSISPVADENGSYTHWIAIEHDITESKLLEEKLIKGKELAEDNEFKMKEAQKLAKLGSWYYDFINQVSFWSEETYSIWGLDPEIETIDLEKHEKLINPKDWERFNHVINHAIENKIPYQMEIELLRPDGTIKTVNTIGAPVFDEDNKLIAYKGTTQDISERIIIENELRSAIKKAEESDARFKSYTQQSPIGIYTTDINGDCIYANETWLEMAAMQLEDALGKGWINALHPEDLEYVTNNWYKSIESNGEWNYEYRFVNSNKDITWINGRAKKLFNDKNELIGYLGSNVNITKRKKAEQEKNTLLTTLEKSLNEIYVFDAETLKFSYINQGALNNLGFSEQEIKELTPLDLKPEFTATTFNQLLNPLVTKEKEKIIFLSNHKRKNGSFYPVEVHLQLVSEDENKRFVAIILDITERKKAEKNILVANERFEKVTKATTDAIWDWDIESDIFFRGEGFEKLFGYQVKQNLNQKDFWQDSFHPEDLPLIKKSIEASLTDPSKEFWQQEYRILSRSGETRTVIDKGVIIRDEKGKPTRMVGAITDITEEKNHKIELLNLNKKLEKHIKELEFINQQLEQFAFIASHDLQEPLRMITSFMNQLQRKYGGLLDEKGNQYIHFATDGAKRMKQIILDLLEYSRAGRTLESPEQTDTSKIIEDYIMLRKKVIRDKMVKITYDKLPTLEIHQSPFTQVFHCLIDNAIKYSKVEENPEIHISSEEKNDHWLFSVKDNGIGIPKEFYEKIFVIFQRLHNKDEYSGTGIGLSIVKKHIEAWGGRVWLDSELGKGSTFHFTIKKN